MESVKPTRSKSCSETEVDSELNDEQLIADSETALEGTLKVDAQDPLKNDTNTTNERVVNGQDIVTEKSLNDEKRSEMETAEMETESEKVENLSDPDKDIDKKNRKRKASDIVKSSSETEDVDLIEDENDKKDEEIKDTTSDAHFSLDQTLGKGKRARIPNKRYSDIALSPATKNIKVSHLENGEKEKEKIFPIERIESEVSGSSSPTPKRMKSSIDLKNPNFLKPFKFGWKRELVWRSVGEVAGKRNGDIYYYSPEGKKFRSMREVADGLKNKELSIDDFTFFKEPLGLNDPEKEVIRDAKVKSIATPPSTPIITKKTSTPKPKRVLSPKIMSPKVTSPKVEATNSTQNNKAASAAKVNSTKTENSDEEKKTRSLKSNSSKVASTVADNDSEGKSPRPSSLRVKVASKAKPEKEKKIPITQPDEESSMAGKKGAVRRTGKVPANSSSSSSSDLTSKPCQPCSIRCPGVQGLIPTLQCRSCLCLYHNECVGMVPNINIPNYVCKNCQLEQGGQNLTTGIAPPPLTPITALQSVTTQPAVVLPKLQRIPKSPENDPIPDPPPPPSPAPNDQRQLSENVITENKNVNSTENTSILGHVTSWLPENSRIQVDNQQRNAGEIAEPTRPQYVEFLGGRKFLIIPKYNVVSVSPTVVAAAKSCSEPTTTITGRQRREENDLITGQTAEIVALPTDVKSEPISPPSKPENSQTLTSELMEINDGDGSGDVKPILDGSESNDATSTNETQAVTPKTPVSKKKTIKLNNITNFSNEKSSESKVMENYLQNLSYGYNTLLYVFQYLKVQDLLRAGCVCTMWKDIASHPLLWRTVRMKNSQVHSFEGLANTLQKHGTIQLDLRKMLLPNSDEIWPEFSSNIGKVETLRKIELCRCPSSVVENLMESNRKLEVVNAVTIRCEKMNLNGLANWTNLRELRLKSTTGLTLESDIDSLKSLVNLKTLSLTSIRELNAMKLDVIAELSNLESLDLGECTDFPENFGRDILSKLSKLEKLRLEKGQGNCHTFEMLEAVKDMTHLEQLELVNFDIKGGFDKALGACKNIKKLLIIPTYISQSATTNHMVLGGVLRLQKSLSHFVWGVTLELLRVTELFVDQCEEPEKKEKKEKKHIGNGDSIPVLKPVPLVTDDKSEIPPALDPPQVEILALPGLQKLLLQSLPTTRVKILKIPFHATWRQSITDAVN